ncbi:MAG: hypothetical protein AAGC57_00770 [Pseudomonadota bacterium]
MSILLGALLVLWGLFRIIGPRPQTERPQESADDNDERGRIGLMVIKASGLVLVTIGFAIGVAIFLPTGGTDNLTAMERIDALQTLLTAYLPLLGTWVGTVLAFYFSRDNFKVAADATQKLVQSVAEERLQGLKVANKMIRFGDIREPKDLTKDADTTLDALHDLVSDFDNEITRIVVHDNNRGHAVIHDSTIYRLKASDTKPATLKEILENEMAKQFIFKIGFVGETATLADVQRQMDAIPRCRDVFVTSTGLRTEPVIGWVTDRIVAREARG